MREPLTVEDRIKAYKEAEIELMRDAVLYGIDYASNPAHMDAVLKKHSVLTKPRSPNDHSSSR